MVIPEDEAKEIETNTWNQADSELWITERQKRRTASRVGNIAKMRKTTKPRTKVKNILYITFRGNNATRYGIANEDKARQEYITYLRWRGCLHWNVAACGLFVVAKPWLAASPDGIICNGIICNANDTTHILGLLEIKCPFSMREKTLAEACKSSIFF